VIDKENLRDCVCALVFLAAVIASYYALRGLM
jgi:hypothetical protein